MQCRYCKNENKCCRIVSLGTPCRDLCIDTTSIKVEDILYAVRYTYDFDSMIIEVCKVAEIHDYGIDVDFGTHRINNVGWRSLGWNLFKTFEEAKEGIKDLEMQRV